MRSAELRLEPRYLDCYESRPIRLLSPTNWRIEPLNRTATGPRSQRLESTGGREGSQDRHVVHSLRAGTARGPKVHGEMEATHRRLFRGYDCCQAAPKFPGGRSDCHSRAKPSTRANCCR